MDVAFRPCAHSGVGAAYYLCYRGSWQSKRIAAPPAGGGALCSPSSNVGLMSCCQ
jgi:hypothetical protein